jgi:hypothetical protein
MDVIANIERTIDGVRRRAGERFELPDDSDLVALGVVRDANPPPPAVPEVPEDYPPGFQGLRRNRPAVVGERGPEIEAVPEKQEDPHPASPAKAGEGKKTGRRKRT